MDDNSRRRRQNELPYPASDPRFSAAAEQSQGRGFSSSSSSERYRPAPLTTSPAAARGGAAGATTAYPGYYQEPPPPSFPAALQPNTMQYQSGYTADQRQQQPGFTAYNPDMMYNVAQQAAPVYDSTAQFQARQPAGMQQMLSDVPYFTSESSSAAGPGPPSNLQHHASSSSSNVYQQQQHQSPADRPPPLLQQGYASNMAMGAIPPQGGPAEMMEEDFAAEAGPGMEAAYTTYQTALKEVFQNIIDGHLAEASSSLLKVSEWLLGHVGDLGLTADEVTLHADRIRLWGEFNTAWLSIFQRQKDMLETGQRIQRPQSLMTQEFISKMAKDLIEMCDAIEKHGLIDYQYGVAEERILQVLMECLDLQESIEGIQTQSEGLGPASGSGSGALPPP